MNMIAAAEETLDLARSYMSNLSSDFPETDFPHLAEMVEKMKKGKFSEGKLGRWLGWLQCAVVIGCCAPEEVNLSVMKEINRRHGGGSE